MHPIEFKNMLCPWCGGDTSLSIETVYSEQEYIEECQRCSSPILVKITVPEMEDPIVELHRDNE